jgi:hypothetical protein
MKYIFIVYLFGFIDIATLLALYKLSQTLISLIKNRTRIVLLDGVIAPHYLPPF